MCFLFVLTMCCSSWQDCVSTSNLLAEFKPKQTDEGPYHAKISDIFARALSIGNRRASATSSGNIQPESHTHTVSEPANAHPGDGGAINDDIPCSQDSSLTTALGREVADFMNENENTPASDGDGAKVTAQVGDDHEDQHQSKPHEPSGSDGSAVETKQSASANELFNAPPSMLAAGLECAETITQPADDTVLSPTQVDDVQSTVPTPSATATAPTSPDAHLRGQHRDDQCHEQEVAPEKSDSPPAQDVDKTSTRRSQLFLTKMKQFRTNTKSIIDALDYVPDFLGKLFYDSSSSSSDWLHSLGIGVDEDKDNDEVIFSQLDQLANNLSNRTTSIAFSGVAAHDVADRCLAMFLSGVLQRPVTPPRSAWLIERSNHCQEELCIMHAHEHNPSIYPTDDDQPCLFSDINQFWRPEIKEIIDCLLVSPHLAVETLAELLVERRAVRLTGLCRVHGGYCRLKPCSRHSAGSVCTPYSSQGNQLALNDPSVLFLLCWNLD